MRKKRRFLLQCWDDYLVQLLNAWNANDKTSFKSSWFTRTSYSSTLITVEFQLHHSNGCHTNHFASRNWIYVRVSRCISIHLQHWLLGFHIIGFSIHEVQCHPFLVQVLSWNSFNNSCSQIFLLGLVACIVSRRNFSMIVLPLPGLWWLSFQRCVINLPSAVSSKSQQAQFTCFNHVIYPF